MTQDHTLEEPTDAPESPRVQRRRFLRRGAITAAVAASSAAVLARPASAANGDPLLIGSANTGTSTTTLTGSPLSVSNTTGTFSVSASQTASNGVGVSASSTSGAQLQLTPNALNLLPNGGDAHTFGAGALVTDSNEIIYCSLGSGATVSNGGLHPLSLTAAFFPYPKPIRIYDSRSAGGPLNASAQQERVIDINFGNPGAIVALMCNLTVVDTVGAGFLALFAADVAWNPAQPFSTINWFTNGQITANGCVTAIDNTTGDVRVHAGGAGSTNFVLDAVGAWFI